MTVIIFLKTRKVIHNYKVHENLSLNRNYFQKNKFFETAILKFLKIYNFFNKTLITFTKPT